MRRLILLDFDGTITTHDTLLEFIKYSCGSARFFLGFALLSPYLMAMKLKLIPNQVAKERVLRFFFGGMPVEQFNSRCRDFAKDVIPSLVRPAALEVIRKEKENQSVVSVVSASPENWVKFWCDAQGIGCLSTRLQVVSQKITGSIEGNNCYGPEKARRIRDSFKLPDYSIVVAYGDSRGDREMFELAKETHFGPIGA